MAPTLPIRAAVTAIGLFVPGSEDRVRGFGDSLNYMRGDCVRGECFMFALAMHALAGVCIILLMGGRRIGLAKDCSSYVSSTLGRCLV